VIKTIHGEKYPKKYAELLDLLENDERIHVINKVLSRDEMYGLIKVCDCYVSLHRSEGFGLGIAEAMLLGKPVIATGYSGNMDFMRPDNSCLIDYSLVDVKVAEYPH
jgi:glycosyltransferase involved in cell wall biosynthesis